MSYKIRPQIKLVVIGLLSIVMAARFVSAIKSFNSGQFAEIQSYAFCVILPAVLLILLLWLDEARTKEGLLMRVGSIIQLFLIISLPPVSLYLALGFPVVFLVVEIFSTRVPKIITAPIEKVIIA